MNPITQSYIVLAVTLTLSDLLTETKTTKKLKFIQVISKNWVRGFEPHPKTLPQRLHTALTAMATVHIDKSGGETSQCHMQPSHVNINSSL
jgi:hypothetical protein